MQTVTRTREERMERASLIRDAQIEELQKKGDRIHARNSIGSDAHNEELAHVINETNRLRSLEGEDLFELLPERKWYPNWDTRVTSWGHIMGILDLIPIDEAVQRTIEKVVTICDGAHIIFYEEGGMSITGDKRFRTKRAHADTLLRCGLIDESTAIEMAKELRTIGCDVTVREGLVSVIEEEIYELRSELSDLEDQSQAFSLDFEKLAKMKTSSLAAHRDRARKLQKEIDEIRKAIRTKNAELQTLKRPFWVD